MMHGQKNIKLDLCVCHKRNIKGNCKQQTLNLRIRTAYSCC